MNFDPLATLGSIALIQFLGWMTPGPNLVAIASASMSRGRAQGVITALGIATGTIAWTTLAVGGVALIFELWPQLFNVIRLAGAAYLLWLGYRSLRAAIAGNASHLSFGESPAGRRRAFLTGLLVIMTNPKAPIFFGSIMTAFIPAGAPTWILIAIVVEFFVISAFLNSFTALVFSTPKMIAAFGRHERVVGGVFGVLFIGLGLLVGYETVVPMIT